MFLIMAGASSVFKIGFEHPSSPAPTNVTETKPPSDAVTITPLPPLLVLRGDNVSFEGKAEFKQVLAGRFAKDISIVNFQATGEHAEKSSIKIVWDNGEIETVPPGTMDKKFSSERRAASISVIGYSMHERRLFKDSGRKGTLTWEIRYEPVQL